MLLLWPSSAVTLPVCRNLRRLCFFADAFYQLWKPTNQTCCCCCCQRLKTRNLYMVLLFQLVDQLRLVLACFQRGKLQSRILFPLRLYNVIGERAGEGRLLSLNPWINKGKFNELTCLIKGNKLIFTHSKSRVDTRVRPPIFTWSAASFILLFIRRIHSKRLLTTMEKQLVSHHLDASKSKHLDFFRPPSALI